jgi:hypothetical protein
MWSLVGAAGGALSLLTSFLQSSTASSAIKAGGAQASMEPSLSDGGQPQAVVGSGSTSSPLSSGTLAALIALQGQTGADGTGGLFGQLDGDGNGAISQGEFESAVSSAGVDSSSADALFGKLDANGDGNISQSELAKARHGHHHHGSGHGEGGLSALLNATDVTGASSQTTNNSDGSSTTTITYSDGSTASMTTRAGQGASGGQSNSNLLEQLIKLQAQLTTGSSSTTSTVA